MNTTYLIVYGQNTKRGKSCYKETEIQQNNIIKYLPIIKKIYENINKTENWTGGKTIEKNINGNYIVHNHLYEMYSEFDKLLLDEFNNYLPNGITHIDSIKIFVGEKIKLV